MKLHPSVSTFIFLASGIWLIALGMYFMFLRPPLLPEDLRYMETSLAHIQLIMPGLERWLHRVFAVMGSFIAGAGVLTIFMAVRLSAAQRRLTTSILVLLGLLTVGTMSVINFQLDSDFKWLLLIPALLWFVGVAAYIVSSRSDP